MGACTVEAPIPGLTAGSMRDCITRIRNMDWGPMYGPMASDTQDPGNMENKME